MTLLRSLPGRRTAVVAVVMAALGAALWLSSGVAQAGPPAHAQGDGPPTHAGNVAPPPHANSGAGVASGAPTGGPPAQASSASGPPEHASGGARVFRSYSCLQPAADEDGALYPFPGDGNGVVLVGTPSGNRTVICIAHTGEGPTGGAVIFDHESLGGPCVIPEHFDDEGGEWVETTHLHAVVTPSGIAIFVCQYKDASTDDADASSDAIDDD